MKPTDITSDKKLTQTPSLKKPIVDIGGGITETPVKSEDTMAFIDQMLNNAEASNAKNELDTFEAVGKDFKLPEYE